MPLSEYRKNVENRVKRPEGSEKCILCGNTAFRTALYGKIRENTNKLVLLDGWYGVNWETIVDQFFERSSIPIHDHPGIAYAKRHFNEPLGRYEIYYIVESYKGSSVEHPEYSTSSDRLQVCIIPAGFGKYEYINLDGSHAMEVLIRLKKV